MDTVNGTVTHFLHKHPLSLSMIGSRVVYSCYMCKQKIDPFDRVYACGSCNYFFLHESCTQFQRQIEHPFHPHPLRYYPRPRDYKDDVFCDICHQLIQGCIYHCEEAGCKFEIDVKCAALKPTNRKHANDHLQGLQITHRHSLFACDKPNDRFDYSFRRCDKVFGGDDVIYVCLECQSLLDELCAAHGMEIRLPFHCEHTLTLFSDRPKRFVKCSFCAGGNGYDFYFYCSSCNLSLDPECANLRPTAHNCKINQEEHIQIQPLTHPHPLTQLDKIKDFKSCCFACGLRFFEDFVYACLSCRILLHKSCADLPREISSHLHPKHPLKLVENYSTHSFSCPLSCKPTGYFTYKCTECNFGLDAKCARSVFQLIISEYHKHALTYIDIKKDGFLCVFCRSPCSQFYFRCLDFDCELSIHDHCYPSLPQSIKHHCQIDLLIFTANLVKEMSDDQEEDAEFYCCACKESRELKHPTYCCSSCHFVAHFHCVISAIIPYVHIGPTDLAISSVGELGTTGNNSADEPVSDFGCSAEEKVEDDDAVSNEYPVLHLLDEEIVKLRKQMDALGAKIKELEERRGQYIIMSAKR